MGVLPLEYSLWLLPGLLQLGPQRTPTYRGALSTEWMSAAGLPTFLPTREPDVHGVNGRANVQNHD